MSLYGVRILVGDVRARLRDLPDESVHCVVTSPPYWGLRDYGIDGQLGLERTPEEYVARMVEVFREVRRVMRKDATLWCNIGDGYAAAGYSNHQNTGGAQREDGGKQRHSTNTGLKPKDLVGVPWMLAFALRADGWWLRQDIIWHKPSPMPESVTDRCTKAHEYVFLLAKAARYYYDADAVREDAKYGRCGWDTSQFKEGDITRHHGGVGSHMRGNDPSAGRNLRSVWTIPSHAFSEAHFATFPPKLVEPCVKAGTSERGCCPTCGKPWERVVDGLKYEPEIVTAGVRRVDASRCDKTRKLDGKSTEWLTTVASRRTIGWRPTCDHGGEPVPCTVLDPFGGAGTTALVAVRLQRNAVLIELNPKYAEMARRRIEEDSPMFAKVEVSDGAQQGA